MDNDRQRKRRLLILMISLWYVVVFAIVFPYFFSNISGYGYGNVFDAFLSREYFASPIIAFITLIVAAYITKEYWNRYWKSHILGPDADIGDVDSSALASMERALAGKIETHREETDKRFRELEAKAVQAVSENVREMAERVVREKADAEFGDNVVEMVGRKVAEQASDHTKRLNIKKQFTTLFDNNETRVLQHAKMAERTAYVYRRMGFILAWCGVILAAINLYIFYADIWQGLNVGNTADVASGTSQAGAGAAAPASSVDYVGLLKHLPFTLPFIFLAEVLALIMFRYQSKALEMMRYFSNEVTTLSLRRAGALAIVENGTQKAISDLATELLKSERNIIMRKDEKTIELTQNREADALLKSLMDKVETILKRQKDVAGKKGS